MISELPKLFDRNFATAYFLPSAGFVAIAGFIYTRLGKIAPLFNFSKESFVGDLTTLGIISLLTAVILSILTRHIVRFLEGYWTINIFHYSINLKKYLNILELRYHDALEKQKITLKTQKSVNGSLTGEEQSQLNAVADKLANRFPVRRDLVLPTSFGNTYRAFETYPKEMYGIEAIDGWYRLLAIIPKDYLSMMNDARARVDFGVNLWFFSIVLLIEYIVVAALYIRVPDWQSFFSRETMWWFPLTMLAVSYMSYVFARNAVALWGNWVKAAFDLYLPELRKKLEFKEPENAQEEITMWKRFNQAVAFRQKERLPEKEKKSSVPLPSGGRRGFLRKHK